jgi:steroid delta-isomerase-like uncharacterized protein
MNGGITMTASNRALVDRALHDGLNKRDLSVLNELYANCTYYLPLIGELRGEALTQFFEIVLTAFPDAKRTVDGQYSDGVNIVVTRWTTTATHRGPFMGVAPTGKRITITGITIDRIVSGEIVEEWQQWDSLGMLQQLGVVPLFKFQARAA